MLLRNLVRNLGAGARLAFLARLSPERYAVSPADFATLFCFTLLASFAADFFQQGTPGLLNPGALPIQLMQVPLLLLLGLFIAAFYKRSELMLLLALMWCSADWVFEIVGALLHELSERDIMASEWMVRLSWLAILWVLAVMLRAVAVAAGRRRLISSSVLVSLVFAFSIYFVPPAHLWVAAPEIDADASGQPTIASEALFHAQQSLLAEALDALEPEREGVQEYYFLGVAADASQDVFLREVTTVQSLFDQRFDTEGRSLALINNASTLSDAPIATLTNLEASLNYLGRLLDPDEDVLFLFVTTHGGRNHELVFDLPPLDLQQLSPPALARMLNESGIKYKVVVVSACYSGGFVEPLRDANTIVITAADAEHSSFGCSHTNDWTYFGRALFGEAMKKTFSIVEAFELARQSVTARERAEGLTPSNPQIYVGSEIQKVLPSLEHRLMVRKST